MQERESGLVARWNKLLREATYNKGYIELKKTPG